MGALPGKEVTWICTACNRPDLLIRTLDSFTKNNDYPVSSYIVYEDSGITGVNDEVKKLFPFVKFIEPDKRTGQIVAQDSLWQQVQTPYVLSWEEDWQTYAGGFVEKGISVLDRHPNIVQVWFRHLSDTNRHPTLSGGVDFRYLSTNYHWRGFSFAPSIKRLADYKKIGSYGKHTVFNRDIPWQSEKTIGEVYYKLGYRAAILKQGFVRHIGAGHHVI